MEKQNWEWKELGEVCDFVRGPFGGSLKKDIFKSEGYAVYEQQHAIYDQFDDIRYFIDENKFNEMKRFELKSGDLIMSCSGTMGKMAIVPENIKKGIINQALLKLTPSKKISSVFLKLWMQSKSFQDSLKSYSQGAAIQNIVSVKILKKIKIPLPPLDVQKKIVAVLEKAEKAKELRKEADELTKEFLKAVFMEMFGDLNANNKKFPICPLSEVCEINPRKSELEKGYNKKVSFMAMADIGEEGQIYNIDLRDYDDVKTGFTYFKKNDVLFAKITPCMENGKGVIAKINTEVGFGSTEFHVLRPIKDKTTSEWIYYLLSINQVREEAGKKMTGSAGQKRVPTGFFDILKIPLPPLPLQQKFAFIVEQVEKMKDKQKKSKEHIEELFNSLMQKAFKGELVN